MSLPTTNGIFIHNGYNCTPSLVPTAQSIQMSASDTTTVNSAVSNKMNKADPTGTGSLSINRKAETTVGSNSATLGLGCTASANQTFAAGYNNVASGVTACAVNSTNTASGAGSFCSGYGNIAQRQFNHVFGMYNQADTGGTDEGTKGNYIEIVGKGTNQNSRSNARTLDWNGNEVLAGNLTVGGRITNLDISSVTLTNFNSALSEHVGTNAVLILPNVVHVTLSFTFTSSQAGWANICDFASTKQNTNTFGMVTTGLTVDGKSSVIQAYYSNNKCIIRVNGATGGVIYRGQLLIPLY